MLLMDELAFRGSKELGKQDKMNKYVMGCSSLRQRNLSTRGHFKHMKTRFITDIFLSLATCLLFVNSSQAQQTRTGTHLNSKAQPSESTVLEVPDEVENIRQMLLSGRKNDALQLQQKPILRKWIV